MEGNCWDGLDRQLDDIRTQLQDLRNKGAINKVPNIKDFINGPDEVVIDEPEGLVDQIIQQYQPKELEEGDSNDELLLPKITNSKALHHLHELCRYKEQQDHDFKIIDILQTLRRYKRELTRRHHNENRKQVDIRYWINGHIDEDN